VVMHLASFQSPKARRVSGRLITPADIAVTVTAAYTRQLPHSNTCSADHSSSSGSSGGGCRVRFNPTATLERPGSSSGRR
jgi:hypothetical protein